MLTFIQSTIHTRIKRYEHVNALRYLGHPLELERNASEKPSYSTLVKTTTRLARVVPSASHSDPRAAMTHASAVTLRERRVRRLAPPPATLVPLLFLVSLLIAQVNAGEEEDDLVDFITDEWRGPRGDAPDAVDPHEWLGALTWEERQPPRRQPNATSQSQGAAAAGRPAVSPFDAFVRVEDTRFMLGCAEYKVAGWNTYTLIEQAARVPTGSFEFDFSRAGRRQVIDMFDAAVGAGFNTVRTWAYSVGKHQSMQTAPGVYHEPLFEGLDWVIYQAGLRGLRLILVFTDYWEYNGGVAQYLDWSGTVATGKNVFFGDRRCKEMYKANVKQVIERVNAYTGVAYRVRFAREFLSVSSFEQYKPCSRAHEMKQAPRPHIPTVLPRCPPVPLGRPRHHGVGTHQRTPVPQLRGAVAAVDRRDGAIRQEPRSSPPPVHRGGGILHRHLPRHRLCQPRGVGICNRPGFRGEPRRARD